MGFELQARIPVAARLGESPLWLPEPARFLWLDLLGRRVHRFDPATGADRVIAAGFAENLACLVRLADGDVLLVSATGMHRLDPATGAVSPLASPVTPAAGTVFNDGKVAPDGSLWLGVSDAEEVEPVGSLYRISRAGVECVLRGVTVANGPAFAPDGRSAWFADSVARTIRRFPLDAAGRPGAPSLFARVPEADGLPDGMTADRAGRLLSAHWQGSRITVHDPAGSVAEVIRLPAENVTSCAFGGADCATLLATSAAREEREGPDSPHGDLFVLCGPARGVPEPVLDAGLLIAPGEAGTAPPSR